MNNKRAVVQQWTHHTRQWGGGGQGGGGGIEGGYKWTQYCNGLVYEIEPGYFRATRTA
jgi:hypothetical protein